MNSFAALARHPLARPVTEAKAPVIDLAIVRNHRAAQAAQRDRNLAMVGLSLAKRLKGAQMQTRVIRGKEFGHGGYAIK